MPASLTASRRTAVAAAALAAAPLGSAAAKKKHKPPQAGVQARVINLTGSYVGGVPVFTVSCDVFGMTIDSQLLLEFSGQYQLTGALSDDAGRKDLLGQIAADVATQAGHILSQTFDPARIEVVLY